VLIVALVCFRMFRARIHFSRVLAFSSVTSKVPSFWVLNSVKFRLKLISETAGASWSVMPCFWAILCLKSTHALSIAVTRSKRLASSFSFSVFTSQNPFASLGGCLLAAL